MRVKTQTYVYIDEGGLEDGEWDFEEFKREKLGRWVGVEGEYAGMYIFPLSIPNLALLPLCSPV